MKRIAALLILIVVANGSARPQSSEGTASPQTARQALLEMFFGKTPGILVKHLPAAMISALERSGSLASLQQYSLLASQFQATGKNFETFETGSVLLVAGDSAAGKKFEVNVANDSLQGDEDDIDLSFHVYKNGQAKRTPFMPQITFAMKMESRRLEAERNSSYHSASSGRSGFPAEHHGWDPGSRQKRPAAAQTEIARAETKISPATMDGNGQVIAAMRSILTAEGTYTRLYHGYTCTLSDLDGFGGGEPNEHQAMLISSGLASGKRYGYNFALSSCAGSPANSFHFTAVPVGAIFARPAYCADQSGGIRSSADGNPATCFASGSPVP